MNTRIQAFWLVVGLMSVCGINAHAVDPYSGLDTLGIETIVADVNDPTETWRIDANARIDQHRKADMNITVIDQATGLPVPDAQIDIKLTRHDFHFGGIASAPSLSGDNPAMSEQLYKDTFLNMGFNAGGFNNAFKPRLTGQHVYLPDATLWFADNQIPLRGHCLIWPGINSNDKNHMTDTVSDALDAYNLDPTPGNRYSLTNTIETEMINWSSQWDVIEWDVINEERGNHDIMDALGDIVMVDWFNIAQQNSVNPNVKLLLNENRVISDTAAGIATNRVNEYMATVDFLLDNSAPLTGFGFQSRFSYMLSADTIYQRLQLFDQYDLPISATEFEMSPGVGTDLDKAVMTERVMTTYFSHHLVDGIYAWSLFPSDDKEIVDANGMPNLRGKTWLYLTKNIWMTDEAMESDQAGLASVRGFKGDYDITVRNGINEITVQVTLDQDDSFIIEIELSDADADGYPDSVEGSGDLDLDGVPDYLDAGTYPLAFANEEFFSSIFNGVGDRADGLFNMFVNLDNFDGSEGTTTQALIDVGGGGSSDGLSLVYGPSNVLTLRVFANGVGATANYTVPPEQIAGGMLELSVVVDINYDDGDGTQDRASLYVDRVLAASAVANLASNDYINTNLGGFGKTGGGSTGGWPTAETSVPFTYGTIDYPAGLWYSDNITALTVGWCQAANLDGIVPVDILDISVLALDWLQNGIGLAGDINRDDKVDLNDFNIAAGYWLSNCN
jgi:hypothetical protein